MSETAYDTIIDNLEYVQQEARSVAGRLRRARERLLELDSGFGPIDPALMALVQELIDASGAAETALNAAASATEPSVIGAFRRAREAAIAADRA